MEVPFVNSALMIFSRRWSNMGCFLKVIYVKSSFKNHSLLFIENSQCVINRENILWAETVAYIKYVSSGKSKAETMCPHM